MLLRSEVGMNIPAGRVRPIPGQAGIQTPTGEERGIFVPEKL